MKQSKYIKPTWYNQRAGEESLTKKRYLARTNRFSSVRGAAYFADTIIDLANCENPDSIFNTGTPLCDIKRKKLKGVLFLDKGVVFTGAEIASTPSFIAAIKTKTTAPRGQRVYPMFDLLNLEDNTGDPSTGSIGNLTTATIITSDAVPAFRFGYNGSEALHKKMSAMNGASLDVMFMDDQFAFYGTQKESGIGGYSVLQAYPYTPKFIIADAVNQYAFSVTLNSITEYRDRSAYVVTNSGVLSAVGLINVELKVLSSVDNVFKLKVVAEGGTNLEPQYGAIIDGLPFTAENLETGDVFTITSVTDSPTDDSLTFVFDTDEWDDLNEGDRIQVTGPAAAALSAAGVKPFEIVSLIITKESVS